MENGTLNGSKFYNVLLGIGLLGYLIDPFFLGFTFGYFLAVLLIFNKRVLLGTLDSTSIFILLFSLSYALFYVLRPRGGYQLALIYALFPICFYLIGKYLGSLFTKPDQKLYFLMVLGGIFSATPLISILLHFFENGFSGSRNLPVFWNNAILSATNMGSFFIFNMSIVGVLIVYFKRMNLIVKICLTGLMLASLFCVVRLGSRTQLALFMLSIILALIFNLRSGKVASFIVSVLMVTGLGSLLFYFGIFGDEWLSSFGRRIGDGGNTATAGGRTEKWVEAINQFVEYPLGWSEAQYGNAHNLWLDVAMVGGLVSLVSLMILTVILICLVRNLYNKFDEYHGLRYWIFSFGTSTILMFMVEPIMIGYYDLFMVTMLIFGFFRKHLDQINDVQLPKGVIQLNQLNGKEEIGTDYRSF